MQVLVSVILPVFLVIGFGYVATWRGLISESAIDGVMRFAQNFALPCLLFSAITQLDLGQEFDLALLGGFYGAALTCFAVCTLGARHLFGRPWTDSVAIGFCGLFSNSLLLGVPITERAYGTAALAGNYAIIAFHAPFCYAVGVSAMELARGTGGGVVRTASRILRSTLSNALVVGILLGFVVNLGGIPIPEAFSDALDLMVRAALPAALFGLGGVLYRYRPEGDMRVILFAGAISLLLHPALAWAFAGSFGADQAALRSAVLTAAMAPGVNAYLFANMYGVAKRVAASTVLLSTAFSVVSVWIWLALLP